MTPSRKLLGLIRIRIACRSRSVVIECFIVIIGDRIRLFDAIVVISRVLASQRHLCGILHRISLRLGLLLKMAYTSFNECPVPGILVLEVWCEKRIRLELKHTNEMKQHQ